MASTSTYRISNPPTIRDHLQASAYPALTRYYLTAISTWWSSMGPRAKKATLALGGLYSLLLIIAMIIGPETIFNYTAKVAVALSELSFGKPLILIIIIILSFPPTVGYGSAVGICGLAYGAGKHSVWEGWLLASAGCIAGATISFFVLRHWMRKWKDWDMIKGVRDDKRWKAMEMAVRQRGMFMVVLIRFCPFPFCYSNLFFASMESVTYFQFLISTALITPKLLIHVFLGARMFELMDRESRKEMDGTGKFVNGLYVVIGSLVGMATSYYVWKATQDILRNYEDVDQELGMGRGSSTIFDNGDRDRDGNDRNLESRPFIDENGGRSEDEDEFGEEEDKMTRSWSSAERNSKANGHGSSNGIDGTSKKKQSLQGAWDR